MPKNKNILAAYLFALWIDRQLKGGIFLQKDMQKLKKHNTIEDMTTFSHIWEKFPVLYDDRARNALFKKDFKEAHCHMQDCYAQMAAALGMSVCEVKPR